MLIRHLVTAWVSTHVLSTTASNDKDGANAAKMKEQGAAPVLVRASLEPDPPRKPVKSRGCSVPYELSIVPGDESKRIKIGDSRYVRVTLPLNYKHGKTAAPLVLAFHDKFMTAQQMEDMTLLSSVAYNRDAIVVYPEAQVQGRWQSDAKPPPGANDHAFVSQILDKLEDKLCIDTDRIYATGLGIGAGLVHLLACSNLSSRIAAFSLVNANIFAATDYSNKHVIQDPTSRMWDKCVAYRSVVRIQAIHSENNTIFDYWGNKRYEGRHRKASVENLVDWANRNKCGEGITQPQPWRDGKDAVHKTLLQQGYIFEGFIEEGAVIKATYHCWPGDHSKFQELDMELNEDGSMKDLPPMPKVEDPRTEEEKMEDFLHRVERNLIQEHYYVRNAGHGWNRIEKMRNEDDARRKAEGQPLGYSQELPEWEAMPDYDPTYDPDTSFDGSVKTSFAYGYLEPSELIDRPPRFDTTARVLQFFRSYRLSDPGPKAPRNADGLTEPEVYTVDMFAQQFSESMDATDKSAPADDDESSADAKDHDNREVPIIELGDFSEAAPDMIRRQKDEL